MIGECERLKSPGQAARPSQSRSFRARLQRPPSATPSRAAVGGSGRRRRRRFGIDEWSRRRGVGGGFEVPGLRRELGRDHCRRRGGNDHVRDGFACRRFARRGGQRRRDRYRVRQLGWHRSGRGFGRQRLGRERSGRGSDDVAALALAHGPRLRPGLAREAQKRLRPDIGEKGALRGARQPLERRVQRQPVDGADIAHQFAGLSAAGFHPPVMHDLRASVGLIDQRAEKLVHRHIVTGLLEHLAFGGGKRGFAGIELALGKHPLVALAQPHHRDQRRLLRPQHDASRRQNRPSRHCTVQVRRIVDSRKTI